MYRGLDRVDAVFTLTMAAYNLTRMRGLAAVRPGKRKQQKIGSKLTQQWA